MIKRFTTASAVCLLLAGIAVAGPTATAGSSFSVDYNGHTLNAANTIAGLGARVDFYNFSFTQHTLFNRTEVQFGMRITNTSGGPVTASRISALGFNTSPEYAIIAPNSVSGAFSRSSSGLFSTLGAVDFCFSGVNCLGSTSGGVTLGQTSTAQARVFFRGLTDSLSFDDMFIRYQNVSGAVDSGGHSVASAFGTGSSAAPEPVSLITLAVGCVGIWQLRKRHQARLQSKS
jgi:hypothetical protein